MPHPAAVDCACKREAPLRSDECQAAFEGLREKHGEIYVIVSPPRCCSTAFARVLWEHPAIRYYSHEPFEVTYYLDQGVAAVVEPALMDHQYPSVPCPEHMPC